ncbi:hypothetical protein [Clostridium tagluense]|uniref:Uncharacterized protein n=1 Tax=Clostridium tagluense TaxID=360422 RepID=A0A401USZ9_9CLOT|nr:hypothetical protein [Clostridium tagluense]GCD12631.1 hypothetical protein Ctaglu_42540 [Clostridium tagluense]
MTVAEMRKNKYGLGRVPQELIEKGESITPRGKYISIEGDKFLYNSKEFIHIDDIILEDLISD